MQRILCVDDEPILHEMLDLLVDETLAECQLSVARGAEEAKSLMQEDFDLYLIDVLMPGIDGLALTRDVRASHPNAAIIVFSAGDADDLQQRATAAGADHFMPKPFDIDEFLPLVKRLLEKQAA